MNTTLMNIAVVDDDHSVRKSLTNLLKAAGYRAMSFSSGEEILAFPDMGELSCVLMDLRMGGMQGTEVQRLLAQRAPGLPVICMSAFWDEVSLAEATAQGAYQCLRKPFTAEELLSSIREAVPGVSASASTGAA